MRRRGFFARVQTEKMPVKKKRYNWKARQRKHGDDPAYGGNASVLNVLEDDQSSYNAKVFTDDTNALVLPAKRKVQGSEKTTKSQPKRRKLNSRQRKRLEKIVETKEKKSRVRAAVKARHSSFYTYLSTYTVCVYVRTIQQMAKLGVVYKSFV